MDATAVGRVDFDNPDDSRTAEKATVDIVRTDNGNVARMMLEPGWSWAGSIKPLVGTNSCELPHLGYVQSGTIKITADGGEEMTFSAGDIYVLAPGHHAEIIGDETFIGYEFDSSTAEEYATT